MLNDIRDAIRDLRDAFEPINWKRLRRAVAEFLVMLVPCLALTAVVITLLFLYEGVAFGLMMIVGGLAGGICYLYGQQPKEDD